MFSHKFKILFHDTDINGTLYPSKLLMYMQETTHYHMESIGKNLEKMHDNDGIAFWLMRVAIHNYLPIRAFDEIEVQTWPTDDSRGFSFNRCFRIMRGHDIVAEAYTVWALMNVKLMKPIRVADYDAGFTLEPPIDIATPIHIRIPRDAELGENGSRTILYSDIDYNGHMNNTRYPDMLCDVLPNMKGKFVKEMTISFQHEAALGETITAHSCLLEGAYLIRTVRSDSQTNVEARIVIEEI